MRVGSNSCDVFYDGETERCSLSRFHSSVLPQSQRRRVAMLNVGGQYRAVSSCHIHACCRRIENTSSGVCMTNTSYTNLIITLCTHASESATS